jgi:hypothetical protein
MGWFDDNHWAGSAYNFGSGYMCQGRTTRRRPRTTNKKGQKKVGKQKTRTPSTKAQKKVEKKRIKPPSAKAQKKAEKKRIKRQKERDIQRQNERIAGKHNDKILWKVANTIIRLNDKSGSSLKSIKKVLRAERVSDATMDFRQNHLIVSALKSGTASGALINNGGRYKVATVGGKMGATKKPRNSKKRQQDEGNAAISLLLLNP